MSDKQPRPYTIITAFHQEIANWEFSPAERALLTAFVFCLKLRMDGSSFEEQFPPRANDHGMGKNL